MDIVLLSRWQFALTTVYHFFFVPLTIGLGVMVAVLESIYVKTGNTEYKRLTKFWGKLFLINFAMGVVTGLVMEFQFGMNWSEYSRFVGDIFGAPLAIEALLAFFLESTFLGIWIFGWERLSKKLHAATIWLVAIGTIFSSFFILAANGFMQSPAGFALNNGRAEMVSFGALLGNPRAWYIFLHTVSSGLVTASFFILGFSAYHILHNKDKAVFKVSLKLAAAVGFFATLAVIATGDFQGRQLRVVQPMSAAASEAHFETQDPADFIVVAGFAKDGKSLTWEVKIPKALSMLYFLKPSGEVEGINQIQERYAAQYGQDNYIPLVILDFWTFRVMVGLGFLMLLITLLVWIQAKKKYPEKGNWILKILPFAIFFPYLANTSGWILTETARQPWAVTGLIKTRDAVSPNLTPATVMISLVGFVLVYAILMGIDLFLLIKNAKSGLAAGDSESAPVDVEITSGGKS